MKIWINKCIENKKSTYFNDALTFNLNVSGKGGLIASNIRDGWYRKLGIQSVSPICEDLYILAQNHVLCLYPFLILVSL